MARIQSICVYCGSSNLVDPGHLAAARDFGRHLAEEGVHLVFGGGRVGLMGAMADGALAAGGRATGVIPTRSCRSRSRAAQPATRASASAATAA